jgi:general secretion pathway protein G
MDFCGFAKQSGALMRGYLSGLVQSPGGRRLLNARIQAFTLLELIIIIMIVGILIGIAVPLYADFIQRAKVERAKWEIRQFESVINIYYYKYNVYPSDLSELIDGSGLDPWGNPYQYVSSQDPRWNNSYKFDRNMKPVNSDFDLCSMGPDGQSSRNLNASKSQDDVVRAGNGSFVGLGAEY